MDMSDRENMEFAAKAAGHSLIWAEDGSMCWLTEVWECQHNTDDPWNPKENYRDAFLLAVKLQLTMSFERFDDSDYATAEPQNTRYLRDCMVCDDPYSSTCMAIFLTAVDIGKRMA
jgi:hypothetical protein